MRAGIDIATVHMEMMRVLRLRDGGAGVECVSPEHDSDEEH